MLGLSIDDALEDMIIFDASSHDHMLTWKGSRFRWTESQAFASFASKYAGTCRGQSPHLNGSRLMVMSSRFRA